MKFLCLHGAFGSASNFAVQLAPIEQELEKCHISLKYVNSPNEAIPPKDFEAYFGQGPHYRWLNDNSEAYQSMLVHLRSLPCSDTPENTMRDLLGQDLIQPREEVTESWKVVFTFVHQLLDSDPEIQGIIGYSEGALIASSFILEEARKSQESKLPRRIKCAIFLNGWPPATRDKPMVLADESEVRIDVPTLHVLGANDPYKDGGIALYNVCNNSTAEFFDTARGHILPRSGPVIHELREAVQALVARA